MLQKSDTAQEKYFCILHKAGSEQPRSSAAAGVSGKEMHR